MTPGQLTWCLIYSTSGEPEEVIKRAFGQAHFNSDFGKQTREWLIAEGLITDSPGYCATERLTAFVRHLIDQPLPVQVWAVEASNG